MTELLGVAADPQFIRTMTPALVPKQTFLGVIWAGTAVGTLALSFRYYVRTKFFHKLQLDDLLAGIAWVFLLATAIVWTVIINDVYHMKAVLSGQIYPDATFLSSLEHYLHGSLAVLLMFYLGLWTIKLNFLVFFFRLGGQITYYRIYWWIVTVFTIAAGAVCIGTIQYGCLAVPVQASLATCSEPEATRFQNITLKFNCGLDVFTDALIMSLPISILWNVRVSLTRKLQLAGLFSLVIITMVVAIVRVSVVSQKDHVSSSNQVEITWLYLWHFIESSVALLVACLASFRALFAAKERRVEAEEAKHRYYENEGNSGGAKLKVLKARAKYFQDSLFNTQKTNTETTAVDNNRNTVGSMDYPLKDGARTNERSMADGTDEGSGSLRSVPTLHSHGLLDSVHSRDQSGDHSRDHRDEWA